MSCAHTPRVVRFGHMKGTGYRGAYILYEPRNYRTSNRRVLGEQDAVDQTAGQMIFRQQTLHNGVITIRQHGEFRVRIQGPYALYFLLMQGSAQGLG